MALNDLILAGTPFWVTQSALQATCEIFAPNSPRVQNHITNGFTYSGQRPGIEIVHNCDAEQPSLSGRFDWTVRHTEFSALTSMYGCLH
jgi:hypothetical protein